jgi:creatinine amidohydrolase
MAVHRFHSMTRDEIGGCALGSTALLPVAATEQHGPHLPVCVDTLVAERLATAVAERASPEASIIVCPTVTFGASHHHLVFPGALSLSSDTLLRVLRDLTDSLVSSGFRRVFLLNAHGGNEEVVRLAARELALRHDVLAGAASYTTLAWEAMASDRATFRFGRTPGHAGGFETSLMLFLAPELVRSDMLPLPGRGAGEWTDADPAGKPLIHRHGSWRAIDGVSDDAREASAERGQRLFDLIVAHTCDVLKQFHLKPLDFGRPTGGQGSSSANK